MAGQPFGKWLADILLHQWWCASCCRAGFCCMLQPSSQTITAFTKPEGEAREGTFHYIVLEATTDQLQLDWIGSFLLICGIVLYTMGLSWSQAPCEYGPIVKFSVAQLTPLLDPWTDPHVSATFAVGAAALMTFALYEALVRKDGMFNHALFK